MNLIWSSGDIISGLYYHYFALNTAQDNKENVVFTIFFIFSVRNISGKNPAFIGAVTVMKQN